MYNRIKKLYARNKFVVKAYNFIRFETCPFGLMMRFVPERGTIVDLGCGTGIFLNLLSVDHNNRLLIGMDHDERKVKAALESVNGRKNIGFKKTEMSDALADLPESPDCITLIDVLYYLDLSGKRELLRRCSEILGARGVLIIKDIEKNFGLKFWATFLQEFLMVKIFRLTLAGGLYFEDRGIYRTLLEETGFHVKVVDISKGYCYSHILFVCQKITS